MAPPLLRAILCAALLFIGASVMAQTPERLTVQTPYGAREVLVLRGGAGPRPTLLVLHGAQGTGEGAARTTGFAEAAARRGFNAVFPSGIGKRWHYGPAVRGPDPDDFTFLRTLAAQLVSQGIAAPGKLYIAGISNGGMMTFALVCRYRDMFAGVATVISSVPSGLSQCALPSVPYVLINGTADPVMPFAGGAIARGGAGEVIGAERTLALMTRANGCSGNPVSQRLPSRGGPTSVIRMTWPGCRPGTSVTFYRVEGGGHTVPGTAPPRMQALGATNEDLNAADAVMDVFAH